MYTELVLHNGYFNGCAKMQNVYARTQLRHRRRRVWLPVTRVRYCVTVVEGCGFRSVRDSLSRILRGPFGSERSSVIENWEVVRSSEARNVCKLC